MAIKSLASISLTGGDPNHNQENQETILTQMLLGLYLNMFQPFNRIYSFFQHYYLSLQLEN